ncbi:MAG: hypothetical protein ACKOA8_04100, partial [Deltaproteobacteria bacterium]
MFRLNKKGQGLVEYLVLVCLITVSSIAVVSVVGANIKELYANVAHALQGKKKFDFTEVEQPMIQGRNMDESPAPGRNMTLHIHVVKNGTLLYHMIDWTWITAGIATTSRRGGVTMEMNWNNDGGFNGLEEVVARLSNKSTVPVLQMFRIIN